MTLCQAPVFDGGLAIASKRQLAGIAASVHVAGAGSRGAEGAARGREALDAVPATWYPTAGRTTTTTDARGRFDDESR